MGFRRHYQLDYRQVLATWWWIDTIILADGLNEWASTDENIARLVDREDYWLNSEYTSWVQDPDDDEIKAERLRRKRLGIKPPPAPILYPVAERPTDLHITLLEEAVAQSRRAAEPPRRKITIAELRAMRAGSDNP